MIAFHSSRPYIQPMQPSETARDATAPPRTWTVLSLLEWAGKYLSERGFDEPRLHVELLLASILKIGRLDLYLQFDRPLLPEELTAFKTLFKRRLTHEPLQYILGETEFMGLRFTVNSGVLIPRPETELLVEKSLDVISRLGNRPVSVADIGTGSGNIAIAIAHFAPVTTVTALDVSPDALATAGVNCKRNQVSNVHLEQADIFADVFGTRTFDLILANPPYISVEEFGKLQEEIRVHEPRVATTDEGDGYRFIRRISSIAALHLKPGGFLMMEIGFGQADMSRGIAGESGLTVETVYPDFNRIPRVLAARRPGEV
jgi:release factor glutamine methyltransferase